MCFVLCFVCIDCPNVSAMTMSLLPDTYSCGLRMHRECRERFPRRRLQRKLLVSDPGVHLGTCVTHVPWCMSDSLTHSGGENVPGIPSACANRNFTYLVRGPWRRCEIDRYQTTTNHNKVWTVRMFRRMHCIFGHHQNNLVTTKTIMRETNRTHSTDGDYYDCYPSSIVKSSHCNPVENWGVCVDFSWGCPKCPKWRRLKYVLNTGWLCHKGASNHFPVYLLISFPFASLFLICEKKIHV